MHRFQDVPPGEPFAVSATLFNVYLACPQQALARLWGIYPQPTRALFRGALAHRIFARHLESGPIDDASFAAACREETGAALNAQLTGAGIARPSDFAAIVGEVESLYARFRSLPMDGIEAAEVSFEDEVAEGLVLRGRIDAVFADDDGQRIVDWKTGADLGEETRTQLAFYALAWEISHGAPPAKVEAFSVATGERASHVPTSGELDDIERGITEMVIALRTAMERGEELERTAGPHCRWCPILDGCAEGSAAVAVMDA